MNPESFNDMVIVNQQEDEYEEEEYVAVNPYEVTTAHVLSQITDTKSDQTIKLIADLRELAKIYATPSPNWLELILRPDQSQTIEQLIKLA